ncbi:bis(5'-adenosyl)-triphosphatase enpp4-like [Mytilus californianus]|uniref:bis(5'-adenosyl)-triphosphatase enpp4-like n=1 Tax=Mytilus californianus TaxID=6549 RepID=UPI0022471662|nr:bis(5'-adenosyl)-triphosphatase enpp4-like [Mytilus californianus]
MYQHKFHNLSYLLLFWTMPAISSSLDRKLPKLILISMDGFRYNYLDNVPSEKITNFTNLIENGVKAKYLENVYPTVTYPNHMTLVTGLYPESHGVIHNRFWDPYLEDGFSLTDFRRNFESKWFDTGAEPIWVTNFKAGSSRDSGVILWPAGVAQIKSYMPRVIPAGDDYNDTDWNLRVDTLVKWFQNDKTNVRPINLGLLYFPDPDETAHNFGPDKIDGTITDEVQQKIFQLDASLGYLKNKLNESNLWDEMNIIITSDHGFTNLLSLENGQINLDKFNIDRKFYKTGSDMKNHLVMNLEPAEGTDVEKLFQNLSVIPKMNVYRKCDDSLKKLHYCQNRRIMQFVLEAEEGYFIGNTDTLKNISKGGHGYDQNKVPNMRPFFIAFGPAFRKGIISEHFESVNIYPLMCHILGIHPAPNNGSLDNVRHLLVQQSFIRTETVQLTLITFLVVVVFVTCIGGLYSIGAFYQVRRHQRKRKRGGQEYRKSLLKDDKDDEESCDEL